MEWSSPARLSFIANDPSELRTHIHLTEQIGDVDVHTMIPAEEAGPTDTAVAEYSGGVERMNVWLWTSTGSPFRGALRRTSAHRR